MGAEWYYLAANNQQAGPVEIHVLQGFLQNGSLTAGSLIFGPGLTNWTPVGQVPAFAGPSLSGAPQPQYGNAAPIPTASAVLGYRGTDSGGSGLSPLSADFLRQTKPWVRFISVMMFIGSGLMVLGGFGMMAAGSMLGSRGTNVPGFVGIAYIAMAVIYIVPGIYLHRYASKIGDLTRSNGARDLELALGAQKSFWKFVGISMIVMMVVYALGIFIVVVGGARF